jgi:hypothetical protein
VGTTCSGARSATRELLVSQEESAENLMEVYPNPAKDELHFSFGEMFEGGTLKIVDAIGKERVIQLKEPQGKLDISLYTPGLYIMRVNKGQRTAMKRFIKE